ncbi:hypothetical protein JCM16358_16280 [Halanaerocella petrolearia]
MQEKKGIGIDKELCDLVTQAEETIVVVKSGSNCCCFKGIVCLCKKEFIILVRDDSTVFIPIDAIVSIIPNIEDKEEKLDDEMTTLIEEEIEEDQNKSQSNDDVVQEFEVEEDEDVQEEEVDNKKTKVVKEERDNQTIDIQDDAVETKEEVEEENDREYWPCKIYGYGRKIRINFNGQRKITNIDTVNITELSMLVSDDSSYESYFIRYFSKSKIGGKSIELSLSPAGSIDSVVCNKKENKAIITGLALVHIDDEDQGECNFELVIEEDSMTMEITCDGEIIESRTQSLKGVYAEEPFIISKLDK